MSGGEAGQPALCGDALADRADAALATEELVTAIELYHRAEPAVGDPDRCAGGRWMAYMLSGNFAAAWEESDAIRRRGRPDPHRFWNGEPLAGRRVILRSLHGFGDAVQMFRFLPRLRCLCDSLVVEVPPRLLALAPCFNGMGEVITWGDQAPAEAPRWDVQIEVMELPYLLRITTQDLVPQQHYLTLPAGVQAHVQQVMGSRVRLRVGLIWGAGVWNPSRSIPFELFRALLCVPGIEFWSLQGEADRMAWNSVVQNATRRDVAEVGDGILPLAAVIEQLDLVITVDTLGAHLAGALGVPCWLLLQPRADWRWMCGRENSPWYPSLRLWRQRSTGGWQELLERVAVALTRWRPGRTDQSTTARLC